MQPWQNQEKNAKDCWLQSGLHGVLTLLGKYVSRYEKSRSFLQQSIALHEAVHNMLGEIR